MLALFCNFFYMKMWDIAATVFEGRIRVAEITLPSVWGCSEDPIAVFEFGVWSLLFCRLLFNDHLTLPDSLPPVMLALRNVQLYLVGYWNGMLGLWVASRSSTLIH